MNTEAFVLADAAGVIRFWSEGAHDRLGHTAEEASGRTLDLIVPPQYREAHWNGFRRAFQSGSASVEGQAISFPAVHADGSIVVLAARLTLVRRPQGEVVAAIVVFGDAAG